MAPALPQPPRLLSPHLPQSLPLPPLPLPLLPYRAVLLLLVWALPLWPFPRGDIIPGLTPPRMIHHIPGQPGGPHHPRGPGPQAQGSRPPRDPGCHPYHLIRALLEPQTYPLHPLSGGPTSIAAPSQEMLTAVQEIYTGRFTTISRHFLLGTTPDNDAS